MFSPMGGKYILFTFHSKASQNTAVIKLISYLLTSLVSGRITGCVQRVYENGIIISFDSSRTIVDEK